MILYNYCISTYHTVIPKVSEKFQRKKINKNVWWHAFALLGKLELKY